MKEQIIAILSRYIDLSAYDRGGTSTSIFNSIANEIMQIAEFEELCKPDYAEMHMNDSVMQQNIDAALAEMQAELAEEKKSNKLLHEAMITAEKRGHDKALAEFKAKMPSEEEMLQMVAGHIPWLIASARNSKKYVNPFTSGHAFSEVIRILSENLSREFRNRMEGRK